MIRLTVPSIDEDDLQAVHDVLASGFQSKAGKWQLLKRHSPTMWA